MSCNEGYRLVGSADTTCQTVNGETKWVRDQEPICQGNYNGTSFDTLKILHALVSVDTVHVAVSLTSSLAIVLQMTYFNFTENVSFCLRLVIVQGLIFVFIFIIS